MKTSPVTVNQRNNSIGFLRLAFALMVIYVHCFRLGGFTGEFLWEWSRRAVSAGSLAVEFFFVLSGALIAESWIQRPHLGRFLWHRFLRLAPALWVCLAVTAFVFTPLLYFTTDEPRVAFFSIEPSSWSYVWRNLFLPRTQLAVGIYPNGGPWAGDWNGSLWTLFYEGACYLMIAVLGLAGLLRRTRWLGGAAILAFVVLHTYWVAAHSMSWLWLPKSVDRLFDTPGKELTVHFLAGSLWAIFPGMKTRFLRLRWAGPAVGAIMVIGWSLGVHSLLSPWLLPAIVVWLAHALPLANFERWVGGDYSYGLYIYGYPMQQVLAHFRVHELGFGFYFLASVAATGVCAAASWHFVERPAMSLKKFFSRPMPVPVPV